MCILVLEIILLNSILTFYLSLYHLDSVSDWLNGLGMIGVDLPKLDNLLEMFLSSNFLNSTVKIPEINKVVPKDLNVSAVNTPVFRWVAIHEQDQLWGVMTIATTFIPGKYGIEGKILDSGRNYYGSFWREVGWYLVRRKLLVIKGEMEVSS